MAAGLLNLVYTVLVVLVAVAGIAFVFTTGDDGSTWLGVIAALVVAAFLVAMVFPFAV